MREAETILKSKEGGENVFYVTPTEIYAVWKNQYGADDPLRIEILVVQIQNLYREDLFYSDRQMRGYSAIRDDSSEDKASLELFSDKMKRLFSGYQLDTNMRLRPKPETRRLNLDQLKTMLRSTDQSLYDAIFEAGVVTDGSVFLDSEPNKGNKVALASWPRSGNTFLRKYIELLSGTQTGSDNGLHFNVNFQMLGAKGEEIVDDSIWVVKTHYPWITPSNLTFSANRTLVVVRNPLDSLLSWFHYLSQASHTSKAPYDVAADYPQLFDWWIRNQVPKMAKHYKLYMDEARQKKIPYLFVRFEDLVDDPKPQLELIMRYLLQMETLEGTNAQRRVDQVIAQGQSATKVYNLKDTTRTFNANRKFYTDEQVSYITDQLKEMITFFDYAVRD